MHETFRLSAERALGHVGRCDQSTAEAILEIAYLAIAADRKIDEIEVEAFSHVGARLLGHENQTLPSEQVDTWLDLFRARLDRSTTLERIEQVAASIHEQDARKAAYRIAFFLGIVDLDASDREFEFDLQLIAALGIDQDTADRIQGEVNEAITPPE